MKVVLNTARASASTKGQGATHRLPTEIADTGDVTDNNAEDEDKEDK